MARRTKEDAQETRRAILDAAVEVFSARGVSRSSLADIAQEAGVTRGAIYWHFKNKAEVLNTLWDRFLQPYESIAQASENPAEPDPLGKMRELFLLLFTGLANDRQRQKLFRIFIDKCEADEDSGSLHLRHVSGQVEGFSRIANVLRNAVAHGQLPADLDPHLGAVFAISCIDGLIANWLTMPELYDIERDAPVFVDGLIAMFSCGLKARTAA